MLYRALFDIENNSSAAYKEKENKNGLLGGLKLFMVELGFRETLADIWDSDYKDFVMELLKRAYIQPHKGKSNTRKTPTPSIEKNKGKDVSQNITPLQQMLDIFKHAIYEFEIADFLNNKHDFSHNVVQLEEIIKSKILNKYIFSKREMIYQNIREFTVTLVNYNILINYIHSSFPLRYDNGIYYSGDGEEIKGLKLEFLKGALDNRKKIYTLFSEICDGETLEI